MSWSHHYDKAIVPVLSQAVNCFSNIAMLYPVTILVSAISQLSTNHSSGCQDDIEQDVVSILGLIEHLHVARDYLSLGYGTMKSLHIS